MGKGANKQLLNNSGAGQYGNTTLSKKGSDITDFLTPTLEGDVNNPKGYTPQQMAYMRTAGEQSVGGSTSGITGEANLEAARTRNAGDFQGAIGSGSRAAMRQLSQNSVDLQARQANLQQQQRQQAIDSLSKIYGVDESTALGYLNASTTALHDENQSHPNQQGLKGFIDLLGAETNAAKAIGAGG